MNVSFAIDMQRRSVGESRQYCLHYFDYSAPWRLLRKCDIKSLSHI